jgi:hypothetical protein
LVFLVFLTTGRANAVVIVTVWTVLQSLSTSKVSKLFVDKPPTMAESTYHEGDSSSASSDLCSPVINAVRRRRGADGSESSVSALTTASGRNHSNHDGAAMLASIANSSSASPSNDTPIRLLVQLDEEEEMEAKWYAEYENGDSDMEDGVLTCRHHVVSRRGRACNP